MDFKSDLRDIRFGAFEVLRIQELSESPRYKEATRETLEMVIDEGYKFAREVLAPVNETGDREGCRFEGGKVTMHSAIKDALRKWGEQGRSGIVEAPEWGGQGLPLVMATVLNEMFTGANCATSLVPMLTVGAAHLMERFAPEWLNKLCLENMYSLRWCGTMCLTEPQAGSDVGASKTKAVKISEGTYRISGTKNFITGGDNDYSDNIVHVLLARVEGAPAGTKGLSLFAIPKFRVNDNGSVGEFNDVLAAGIEHKMGIHGTPTCTMNYGDNDNCIGFLIGREDEGMRLMFHLMNEARLWVGMQGLALASASYQQALTYARERIQGTDAREFKNPEAKRVPIVRHPDIRRMLMTMKSWTEGMRALLLRVGWLEDRVRIAQNPEEKEHCQGLVDLLTPVCKAYGSEMGFEMTSLGVQVLGGYGYCKEYPQEQLMRDSRIASIYEGANGIQAMDLFSRKVPMKGGKLFIDYMGEISSFLGANQGKRASLDGVLSAVSEARDRLAKTTMKLGALAKEDIGAGLLQAAPYLKMFGHVSLAFELARHAVIACDKLEELYGQRGASTPEARKALDEGHPDAVFYKGKILSAKFFAANVLTEIAGLEKGMLSGDASALEAVFEEG